MNIHQNFSDTQNRLTLGRFPLPAKALVTALIFIMGIALFGALGQVIIHDIIPTFFSEEEHSGHSEGVSDLSHKSREEVSEKGNIERGDLFSDLTRTEDTKTEKPFYESEQFVWLLKWTHIHLFGINMIFIFIGAIAVFLDMGNRNRAWLVLLPFVGVLFDISAMWLKMWIWKDDRRINP